MFKTKEFWRNFFKGYVEILKTCCLWLVLFLAVHFIFIYDTPEKIHSVLIKSAVYIVIITFIIQFGIQFILPAITKKFPYWSAKRINFIYLIALSFIICIVICVLYNINTTLYYLIITLVMTPPTIYIEGKKEKKRMTEYCQKLSLYKNQLSDDEKRINPVKTELFQIQLETFEAIKKTKPIPQEHFKKRVEEALDGKLIENKEKKTFTFGDTEANLPQKCNQYTFDSDRTNVTLLEFENAKSAASAFDRISFSYVGNVSEPNGAHIQTIVFWSVRTIENNASTAAFIFNRYAVCINVKTGATDFSYEKKCDSSEFMCESENAEKILSSAKKVLEIVSDIAK